MPRNALRPPDPRHAVAEWPQSRRPLSIPERMHFMACLLAGLPIILGLALGARVGEGDLAYGLVFSALFLFLLNAFAYAAIGSARDRGRRPRESRASRVSLLAIAIDSGVAGAVGALIGFSAASGSPLALLLGIGGAGLFAGPFSWALLGLLAVSRRA